MFLTRMSDTSTSKRKEENSFVRMMFGVIIYVLILCSNLIFVIVY